MKKWQENRNYRKIRDDSGKVIAHIITVDGVDVPVSADVFTAYARMDRRERYLSEDAPAGGRQLSLASLLLAALIALEDRDRQLITALFYDHLSTREYARRLGVTQRAVIKRRDRILRDMKKYFENFAA